jgi:hypothetical protein
VQNIVGYLDVVTVLWNINPVMLVKCVIVTLLTVMDGLNAQGFLPDFRDQHVQDTATVFVHKKHMTI